MLRSCLFMLLTASAYLGAASYTAIDDKAAIPVLTPSLALRQTVKIRLDNGLEAYIISDPQADKSAAALVVKAGSWQEPADEPGLAHFLEHMLFMGTEKYPDENAFDMYLSDHGGSTDAFTTDDHTAYVFEVDTSALEGALDRYSSFFKEPRFNPSGVSRELKAIDQEYAKNIENDDIREYQILKAISLENHPFHRFSMGNSRTLSKVARENLIKWYKANYSANIMRLVVISPLSLDALKLMVVDAFSGIPNTNITRKPIEDAAVNPAYLAHMITIEPVTNRRNINIIWELPSRFIDLGAKPDAIICAALGDEGPHSLLSDLKSEGLAETVTCGILPVTEKVQQFVVAIGLTKEGIDKVDIVIERVFQTIAALKASGVPDYLYNDAQQLAKIHYQYQSREASFNDVMRHANFLAYEPIETYPEQTYMLQRFDRKLVIDILDYMTPKNAYYQLSAPSALTKVKSTQKEPWMGARYDVRPIASEWLERWSTAKPDPSIQLPPSNPYIPQQLTIVNEQKEVTSPNPHPSVLKDDASGLIYFAADSQFGVPEVVWQFYLKTPQVTPSPYKAALVDLYAKYITEKLNASSYAASVAGLRFELTGADFGLNVKISGYSDKASLLLQQVLVALKDDDIDLHILRRAKQMLEDEYLDSLKAAPYLQAIEWLRSALFKLYARPIEKARALDRINTEKFDEFAKTVFAKAYVEGLIYGNTTEDQAKQVIGSLYQTLGSLPYPKGKAIENSCLIMPPDKGPFFFEHSIEVQGNGVILAIENGPFTYKARVCQQIFMQAMSSLFFNVLRTQQQTGYIVTNYVMDIERELFSCLLVQSNTHDPRDLIARFELFLEGYLQELTKSSFPKERFEKIKASLIAELKHPAKNQEEMAEILFRLAFKYKGDFGSIEKRIQALEALTYEECIGWAAAQFGPSNKRRLAICTKGEIPVENSLNYKDLTSLKQLRKLSVYNQ